MRSFIKTNRWAICIFSTLQLIIIVTLSILVHSDVITFAWISGFFLSMVLAVLAFILLRFSIKKLTKNKNPFEFVFYGIVRFTIYTIPFLFSICWPNILNIFGAIIGTNGIILLSVCFWKAKTIN